MLPHGYRDVFICVDCQRSDAGQKEFQCERCGSYVCEHLALPDGESLACFCCFSDQSKVWPDYAYTILPNKPASE